MGESLWLHERCLALQLLRNEPPPSRPPKQSRPSQESQQRRSSSRNSNNDITPTSPSTGSETPTPTNGCLPELATPANRSSSPKGTTSLHKYQDGYLLFQAWQAANTVCVWNTDLLLAIQDTVYIGLLVGGILLVGGSSKVLAAITHAWSRSLLMGPSGFTLTMLGEVSGCKMVAVPQGHFTPLADALCWVIHRLTEKGGTVDPEVLHSKLTASFPSLNAPDSAIIHATLSSLIHQRKVYHSGRSYGIVHPDTYQLTPVAYSSLSPSCEEGPPGYFYQTPPHPSDCKASRGGAQLIVRNGRCHAIVQTDLAELITGATLPTDKVITPRRQDSSRVAHPSLERQTSLGVLPNRRNHSRTSSLRLSPTKVAQLASAFGDTSNTVCNSNVYVANDKSDITVKGEKGSVLTKLLRVSPRRRLASFSAQFPPQEWTDPNAKVIHLHSVAVQTSSRQRKDSSDILWSSLPSWAPRSSTLPRRLHRPLSCTPSLSHSSHSETHTLVPANSHQVLIPESFHASSHSAIHASPKRSPLHRPHMPCKGSLDRLASDPSHYCYSDGNSLAHEGYRHISRSDQCVDSFGNVIGVYSPSSKMECRRATLDGASRHASPEHYVNGMNVHGRIARKPPLQQYKKTEEGFVKRKGDCHPKKLGGELKGKEITCIHKQKHHTSNKGKQQKLHESSCRHKTPEKDQHREQDEETKNFQGVDYDETPVRDHPNVPKTNINSYNAELPTPKEHEGNEKEKRQGSHVSKEMELSGGNTDDPETTNTTIKPTHQDEETKRYNRSSLQLDLTQLHMNNSKKVVSSPHRPEGLKNNMLHDSKGMNDIKKGSSHELTNRNLGYRDVDKCHKLSCSQTLDEAHQVPEQTPTEEVTKSEVQNQQNEVHKEGSSKCKSKSHRSPKKKVGSSLPKDPNIMVNDKSKVGSKAIDSVSPDDSNVNAKKMTPDAEVASVNTYPSLSELNLNFSSLAAQKILHGVSHNSIDTLVEVNLAAEKRKVTLKRPEAVTNTDFGFL